MNINPRDLGELEIPLKDLAEQEHELYLKTAQQASRRWQEERGSIYRQIFAG